MQIEPLLQLPAVWTGTAGRFGIHVFEGHLTISDMDQLESNGDQWFRKHPGKLVELVVILPSRSRMTADERNEWRAS
jgi:hypothetical protein